MKILFTCSISQPWKAAVMGGDPKKNRQDRFDELRAIEIEAHGVKCIEFEHIAHRDRFGQPHWIQCDLVGRVSTAIMRHCIPLLTSDGKAPHFDLDIRR